MNSFKYAAYLVLVLSTTSCASIQMPSPDGDFLVGTTRIDLVDTSRVEHYSADPTVKRKISAQIWYPAETSESSRKDFYISKDLRLAMQKYMGIPSFITGKQRYSNSYVGVPVKTNQDTYPVIIFNHGYGSHSGQNYSQMESLASQGFIVFSISHPYTTILTEFADGTVCERAENPYWKSMKELQKNLDETGAWYRSLLEKINREPLALNKKHLLTELVQSPMYATLENDFNTWVGDTIFLIRSLEGINMTPGILFEKIDHARLGMYGHSFGGSVSTEVALRSPTLVKAGINFDGPGLIYDQAGSAALQIPFMFVYSTDLKIGNTVCNQTGLNDSYAIESKSDCYSVTLRGSAHHSFSDMTYIGFLKNSAMLGPIDGRRAGMISDSLVATFFKKYLAGSSTELESLRHYDELIITTSQASSVDPRP